MVINIILHNLRMQVYCTASNNILGYNTGSCFICMRIWEYPWGSIIFRTVKQFVWRAPSHFAHFINEMISKNGYNENYQDTRRKTNSRIKNHLIISLFNKYISLYLLYRTEVWRREDIVLTIAIEGNKRID